MYVLVFVVYSVSPFYSRGKWNYKKCLIDYVYSRCGAGDYAPPGGAYYGGAPPPGPGAFGNPGYGSGRDVEATTGTINIFLVLNTRSPSCLRTRCL